MRVLFNSPHVPYDSLRRSWEEGIKDKLVAIEKGRLLFNGTDITSHKGTLQCHPGTTAFLLLGYYSWCRMIIAGRFQEVEMQWSVLRD